MRKCRRGSSPPLLRPRVIERNLSDSIIVRLMLGEAFFRQSWSLPFFYAFSNRLEKLFSESRDLRIPIRNAFVSIFGSCFLSV